MVTVIHSDTNQPTMIHDGYAHFLLQCCIVTFKVVLTFQTCFGLIVIEI